ncbi:synaptobrevin-domain-containing protein [Baffinella frigidus]|nr:synaptobrevin-domain-containing protein [Cryptophyta sp. CCMP2293]
MQADKDYMYIVFVEKHYPERVAFDMLRQVGKDFKDGHSEEGKVATENSLSKAVKKWMAATSSKFDDVAAVDKVAGVQAQVDDVKMTMEDNVQQMLRQHEKLEDLEDKADTMRSEASKFKKGAGQLASRMWWQNARLCMIISVVVVIILLIIIFSVCKPCRGDNSED